MLNDFYCQIPTVENNLVTKKAEKSCLPLWNCGLSQINVFLLDMSTRPLKNEYQAEKW